DCALGMVPGHAFVSTGGQLRDSPEHLPVRLEFLVPPMVGSHLKGRDVRERRRTGHQVVGVGGVYQKLLVLVPTTPLRHPRPCLTGHDGGLLLSMRGPTPGASMTYADTDSTRAT